MVKRSRLSRKVIETDWDDMKSIRQSEVLKARLERQGFNLVDEKMTRFNTSVLTYLKGGKK
jgi:hypothetical protein